MEEATRWCPECRAEYRPHIVECADCLVPLVDELPVVDRTTGDQTLAEWELMDWSDQQLRSLFRLLEGSEIDYDWDGENRLTANADREDAVDELLAMFEENADFIEPELIAVDEVEPPHHAELAPWGRRIGATFLDGFLVSTVAGLASLGFDSPVDAWRSTPFQFTVITATVLYEVIAVARFGRTIGKMAFDLHVEMENNGGRPSWWASCKRTAPTVISSAPYLSMVGPVMYGAAFFDDNRRGLHDKLAGTIVIYRKKPSRFTS